MRAWLLLLALTVAGAAVPDGAAAQAAGESSGADARVQPGDRISIRVFREPELSDTVTVDLSGNATVPRLGRVYVLDRTAAEVQDHLRDEYARYLRNPTVEVFVLRRIGVHGEVRRPDLYVVDLTMTLRDVLALAGGLTPDANPQRVYVLRDGARIELTGRDVAQVSTAELRSGDQVMVGRRSWIARNPHVAIGAAISTVGFVISLGRLFGS